jgi:carbon monoxide dehydrogenase subunit G
MGSPDRTSARPRCAPERDTRCGAGADPRGIGVRLGAVGGAGLGAFPGAPRPARLRPAAAAAGRALIPDRAVLVGRGACIVERMPVSEQSIAVAAAPEEVFAFLHDPADRPAWDAMVDLCRLEGERPAVGARLHLRGRRKAPSWVGEYVEFDPPRRSVVRLLEGVGMPFSDFRQTITVAGSDGGAVVGLRLEYRVRGPLALIEPVTVRGRLARACRRSLENVQARFA